MKKNFLYCFIILLTQHPILIAQEVQPTRLDYNKQFEKNAIPGSYEEITFTREKLILLKKYEPITEAKINALIYLRVISKTQGAILSTKHDSKGIIIIPDLEKALKEKNVSLSLIQKVMECFSGPYTKEVLNKMVILGIINSDEKAIVEGFVDDKGFLPGVPPEQPVIVVKDNWEGIPLTSLGMIDSDQMLIELYKDKDLSKLKKILEKHQKLLLEFEDISSPTQVSSAKDIKKARQKQEKEMASLLERMIPVEKDIAEHRDLMAYLYLAGVMHNRYDSTFSQIKDVDRDASTLIQCLLKPTTDKKKGSEITADRRAFGPTERFICIDKTLMWLQNNTSLHHKRLAENVLRVEMEKISHPPFDAPADMWQQWWQLQQKKVFKLVGGTTKESSE